MCLYDDIFNETSDYDLYFWDYELIKMREIISSLRQDGKIKHENSLEHNCLIFVSKLLKDRLIKKDKIKDTL